jgi:hypothetical protein
LDDGTEYLVTDSIKASDGAVARPRGTMGEVSKSFNAVKVFSATMFQDRERLGDKVSDWIASHPENKIADVVVTQSSDAAFHCIAISVFYLS